MKWYFMSVISMNYILQHAVVGWVTRGHVLGAPYTLLLD
jgi:hypothetical protein